MESKKKVLPADLWESIQNKIDVLFEAIEADETPDQQISFRMAAAKGSFSGTSQGEFQLIIEICVDSRFFLADGEIEIQTDPAHGPEPYKIFKPGEI